jgi:hypothetical protein
MQVGSEFKNSERNAKGLHLSNMHPNFTEELIEVNEMKLVSN